MKSIKSHRIVTLATVVAIAALALVLSGCSNAKPASSGMKPKPKAANTAPVTTAKAPMASGKAMPAPDPTKQMCAQCSTKIMPVPMNGTVESVDGKQVIKIAIKNGAYLPNRFVAEAGKPVTVEFTVEGKPAMGCVSKPTFSGDKTNRAALKKTLTVTSGTESVDLGSLAAGTYEFSCAMGMNVGQIVVQ